MRLTRFITFIVILQNQPHTMILKIDEKQVRHQLPDVYFEIYRLYFARLTPNEENDTAGNDKN